jgi:hypothetical protein
MACYAFRRWGQESDADDFSEEIFFKAFRKLKGGQPKLTPFQTRREESHLTNGFTSGRIESSRKSVTGITQ